METTLYIPPLGLAGQFDAPADFAAAVIFAHGTSSGRMSPRNLRVAARLREAGFATLLMDLLTEKERSDPANQFDVHRQSERLLLAVRHLRATTAVERKPIGFFGAGSGAASALIAAGRAAEHDGVGAVVCRGGRPDLAEEWLNAVAAPPCWWSAARTHRRWTSTTTPSPGCTAPRRWKSCRGPDACSRRRGS
ncbi:dienelactone hydrolase family protein [Azospirillum argentinense]|uniref:Dienelactone hydrolase domain-containing protein n=1 Tax=Azospirillum brasilense TaxID=192 RepID=A0A4D8PTL6_AZOBR|nr:hypothetical protein [Azospirillum argentinense]QCO01267.1 hypothetical protein D3867_03925 [Azospirillum argentinense]